LGDRAAGPGAGPLAAYRKSLDRAKRHEQDGRADSPAVAYEGSSVISGRRDAHHDENQ